MTGAVPSSLPVPVVRLDGDLPLPHYAHHGDAGLDLHAVEGAVIAPGDRALVRTGVAVAIPEGFAGFVMPRSGRALREGLSVVNAPGLIDSHYRGEIAVILLNTDSRSSIEVTRGDKIAQLVVQRVERVNLIEVDQLDETQRGEGGFGSSGS